MGNTLESVKRTVNSLIFKTKSHSSEILLIGGAVGVVTAAVFACKASTKLEKVLAKEKDNIQNTKELYSDVIEDKTLPERKEYTKQITKDYAHLTWEVTKLYAPSVLLGGASLGMMIGSNINLRKRNAELAAACTVATTMFKNYRANVIEAFGEDVDRDMRFGIRTKQVEVTETLKNGKEKTTTKKVNEVTSPLSEYSDYARFFDEGCAEWTKDPEYNLTMLKCREREANIRLKSQGHLFLNEVYDMLGIPRTKAGNIVGWVYDLDCPMGDNMVDFGIYDLNKEANRNFVNGYENVILLDFNVDGPILDSI